MCPSELLAGYESDIDTETARRAFAWTYQDPKGRGEQVRREYAAHLRAVAEEFEPWVTDVNREAMMADLEHYRQGYRERCLTWLAAHSRCASSFVTGGSNFPVARMEKRNATEHKRSIEWQEWSAAQLTRLRRKYDPQLIAAAPIASSDPDAPEKLREKIEKAKAYQETCKVINRIVRRKIDDEAKVLTIMAETGFSEETARKLLEKDFAGRIGIPAYELTNNLANIKRMEARLAEIERQRAEDESNGGDMGRQLPFEPGAAKAAELGGVVIDDPILDRYQIRYEFDPGQVAKIALKAHGFHWTPTLGIWQRQRTQNAKVAVYDLTGVRL